MYVCILVSIQYLELTNTSSCILWNATHKEHLFIRYVFYNHCGNLRKVKMCPHFIAEKNEKLRSEETCPRWHNRLVSEPGLTKISVCLIPKPVFHLRCHPISSLKACPGSRYLLTPQVDNTSPPPPVLVEKLSQDTEGFGFFSSSSPLLPILPFFLLLLSLPSLSLSFYSFSSSSTPFWLRNLYLFHKEMLPALLWCTG